MLMLAVCVDDPGGPEKLYVGQVSRPQLRAGEILIKIHATALNRADLLQVKATTNKKRTCSTRDTGESKNQDYSSHAFFCFFVCREEDFTQPHLVRVRSWAWKQLGLWLLWVLESENSGFLDSKSWPCSLGVAMLSLSPCQRS